MEGAEGGLGGGQPLTLPPPLDREHPIAIAHRGSMTLWPENTMAAFAGAVNLGFRYLETDLRISRDGVLVTFHDPVLDRTTDGSGLVRARTFAELRRLDAAYHFLPEQGHPQRGRGIGVPSLEEAVTAFPEAVFMLDIKQNGLEDPLLEIMERCNLWERAIVGSFGGPRLRRLRARAGRRITTAAGPGEILRFATAARLGRPSRIPADLLSIPVRRLIRLVDARTVAAARSGNLPMLVWTINETPEMARLLDLGVDGLITDRPDLLKQLMMERGRGGPWNQTGGAAPPGQERK